MKRRTSIKLKAGLLLFVFALNTMRSIACAVDVDKIIDSVFHITHHHNEDNEQATESLIPAHDQGEKSHHHDEKNSTGKDDCCDTKVVSFDQLAKATSHQIRANFTLPVLELPDFFLFHDKIYFGTYSTILNYYLRNFHSPPEDIRVSIRSFQI